MVLHKVHAYRQRNISKAALKAGKQVDQTSHSVDPRGKLRSRHLPWSLERDKEHGTASHWRLCARGAAERMEASLHKL